MPLAAKSTVLWLGVTGLAVSLIGLFYWPFVAIAVWPPVGLLLAFVGPALSALSYSAARRGGWRVGLPASGLIVGFIGIVLTTFAALYILVGWHFVGA